MKAFWFSVHVISLILVFGLTGILQPASPHSSAFLIDIPGPPNSGIFGETVTVLPNGNFVVTDPDYPFYTNYSEAKGAVYLYSPNGVLISRLAGERVGNSVGSGGITVLTNGNYVVSSPLWDSVTTQGVGAVTWCSQVTGCSGTVSTTNSLVGSSSGDMVGYGGVTALTNGNYVVSSPHWQNGSIFWAGAVTWGNGEGGTQGVVSVANSLVGSSANDKLGDDISGGVRALANGNYLVLDPYWDNGSAVDAGAVTWGNGKGGTAGAVSAANSLVGSSSGDSVGDDFMAGSWLELTNSSYVVVSMSWDLDATHPDVGAVTWGSGTAGLAGPISASNSLIGLSQQSHVGDGYVPNNGVTALTNGNYVVSSPYWSPDGTGAAWGAVTWGSGTAGVSGQISASNSLVGSAADDSVGIGNFFGKDGVIALTNGNYVVTSYNWNKQGAVTWGDGTSGITGPVSISNSLVGTPGTGKVIALANGNYAASSPCWYDQTPGSTYVSAVTWGNGTTGTTGEVSTTNSLVSVDTGNCLGTDGGLVALTNGNYVWINVGVGVTWVNGSHVTTGVVSAANSLVGSTQDDQVGSGLYGGGVKALTNGNYVVISPNWDNGVITDAGAVTWGDGANGTTGLVSVANSLVGSTMDDQLGGEWWNGAVTILTNGGYVVSAPQWDNGSIVDAGEVTWGNGEGGTTGPVTASNSLVGSTTGDMGVEGAFGGDFEVLALLTGNYIVNSPHWSSVGAVTWGDGTSGTVGAVSASNSLVNTCTNDPDNCLASMTALADGNASIQLPKWSNGSNNGAVSLIACGPNISAGPVSMANSVLGSALNKGSTMISSYDVTRSQLLVGRPSDNKVTILRCQTGTSHWLYLPSVFK